MLAKNDGGIYRRESYEEMLETVKDPYFFRFLVEGAYKDLFLFNFRVRIRCDTSVIIYIYMFSRLFVVCFCNSSIRKCLTCKLYKWTS